MFAVLKKIILKNFLKGKKKNQFWWPFLGILVFDQSSKILIIKFFPDLIYKSRGVFNCPGFIWMSYFIFLMVVFFLFFKKILFQNKTSIIIFGLVLGAGFSNIIDKAIYGGVLDWLSLFSLKFNLADFTLIIGGVILIYQFWRQN